MHSWGSAGEVTARPRREAGLAQPGAAACCCSQTKSRRRRSTEAWLRSTPASWLLGRCDTHCRTMQMLSQKGSPAWPMKMYNRVRKCFGAVHAFAQDMEMECPPSRYVMLPWSWLSMLETLSRPSYSTLLADSRMLCCTGPGVRRHGGQVWRGQGASGADDLQWRPLHGRALRGRIQVWTHQRLHQQVCRRQEMCICCQGDLTAAFKLSSLDAVLIPSLHGSLDTNDGAIASMPIFTRPTVAYLRLMDEDVIRRVL